MVLEGLRAGEWELTKPCANEESGDALGVVVFLALENFTSYCLLLQLKRQKEQCQRTGENLDGGPSSSLISSLVAVTSHQDSCQLLPSWPIILTKQGRELSIGVMTDHQVPGLALEMIPTRPSRSSSSLGSCRWLTALSGYLRSSLPNTMLVNTRHIHSWH